MTQENPALSILTALCGIGDPLEQLLGQRHFLQVSGHQLDVDLQNHRSGQFTGFQLTKDRVARDVDSMREQLKGVETALAESEDNINPPLKAALADLHRRMSHLVEHGKADTSGKVDTTKEADASREPLQPPPSSSLVDCRQAYFGTEIFISALEQGAEAYQILARVKAAYLPLRQQRKRVIEEYEDMEANFIDHTGDETEKTELEHQLGRAEGLYLKLRVDYIRTLMQLEKPLNRIHVLQQKNQALRADLKPVDKMHALLVKSWMIFSAMQHSLIEKERDSWALGRQDISNYLLMQATPTVRQWRQERNELRGAALGLIDCTVHQLLERKA